MTLISPTVLAGLMRRQRECGRNNKRKKKKKKKKKNNNNNMPTIGVPMDLAPPGRRGRHGGGSSPTPTHPGPHAMKKGVFFTNKTTKYLGPRSIMSPHKRPSFARQALAAVKKRKKITLSSGGGGANLLGPHQRGTAADGDEGVQLVADNTDEQGRLARLRRLRRQLAEEIGAPVNATATPSTPAGDGRPRQSWTRAQMLAHNRR